MANPNSNSTNATPIERIAGHELKFTDEELKTHASDLVFLKDVYFDAIAKSRPMAVSNLVFNAVARCCQIDFEKYKIMELQLQLTKFAIKYTHYLMTEPDMSKSLRANKMIFDGDDFLSSRIIDATATAAGILGAAVTDSSLRALTNTATANQRRVLDEASIFINHSTALAYFNSLFDLQLANPINQGGSGYFGAALNQLHNLILDTVKKAQ